jgi:N-acetylmuramoyl-L-alanine amidase CwlA
VCHPDATGRFNDVTYNSLVKITAWLCENSGLDKNDVIRHYDVTGKNCPLYFVENEEAFETFKLDVEKEMEKL